MANLQSSILNLQSLPSVAEMMRAAGLSPKKSLGQNFLFDLNLTGKIARTVPDIENTTVVEVGPGPGGLTRALLMAGAKRVIAIEKDKTTAPILEQIASVANGRLEIIFGDALKIFCPPTGGKAADSPQGGSNSALILAAPGEHLTTPPLGGVGARGCGPVGGQFAICSNLPYNIGTELLIHWLHIMAGQQSKITSLTLMFQKEVAQRIVARPGDPAYGRLSVLVALTANAKILFDVPNTAFVPMPKVQSAVVQILPKNVGANNYRAPTKSQISVGGSLPLQSVEKLTALLFGQRRKMIRGILRDTDWAQFGLSGRERAEELSPEKFAEIAAVAKI